jgi:hypothetical protein
MTLRLKGICFSGKCAFAEKFGVVARAQGFLRKQTLSTLK